MNASTVLITLRVMPDLTRTLEGYYPGRIGTAGTLCAGASAEAAIFTSCDLLQMNEAFAASWRQRDCPIAKQSKTIWPSVPPANRGPLHQIRDRFAAMSEAARKLVTIDDLEARQNEVLDQLDDLNARIEATLRDFGASRACNDTAPAEA